MSVSHICQSPVDQLKAWIRAKIQILEHPNRYVSVVIKKPAYYPKECVAALTVYIRKIVQCHELDLTALVNQKV